jgi:hypothetical protein
MKIHLFKIFERAVPFNTQVECAGFKGKRYLLSLNGRLKRSAQFPGKSDRHRASRINNKHVMCKHIPVCVIINFYAFRARPAYEQSAPSARL